MSRAARRSATIPRDRRASQLRDRGRRRDGWFRPVSGGYGEGETPLPIPNRAVKPLRADGTWPERARESRSPPVFFERVTKDEQMRDVVNFLRANPQVLVLLVICLVLGL